MIRAIRCPKCKNLNISRNLSDNTISCYRCNFNGKSELYNTYQELVDEVEENINKKSNGE